MFTNYICRNPRDYTAYIQYKLDSVEHDKCISNTYLIANYFNLPTTRNDGEPSYTYTFHNENKKETIYEIGIIQRDSNKITNDIKIIQEALKNKGFEITEIMEYHCHCCVMTCKDFSELKNHECTSEPTESIIY
jgi:hypothetical protein